MTELITPRFPDDFRVLRADGGASYWWWSPYTGPDYDGTWPVDGQPPQGLMIGTTDSAQATLIVGHEYVVSWEFGLESESGPWHTAIYRDDVGVQNLVRLTIAEVRVERAMIGDLSSSGEPA